MRFKLKLIAFFIFPLTLTSISQDTTNPCKIDIPDVVCMDCKSGNDYLLIPFSNCQLNKFRLTIFNRWGQELFKTKSMTNFWDASEVKSGTFYWVIEGEFYDGQKIDLSGHVTKL